MFDASILFPSLLNGLTTGAVYALVALGLTLIYGVLHIINFAHGAVLMVALYAVYLLKSQLGIDPYLALPLVAGALWTVSPGLALGLAAGLSLAAIVVFGFMRPTPFNASTPQSQPPSPVHRG